MSRDSRITTPSITPDQLKDHLLDALVGYAFATLDPAKADTPPFEFLKGRAIVTAYKNGPGSCMAGWCSQYVDFYALNPKRVQLMVLNRPVTFFANGTETTLPMKARALLWTADDGRRMLDRVYVGIGGARHNEGDCSATLSNGTNGHCVCRDVIRAYRHWATKHDVVNRASLVDRFEVTMKLGRHVPYMDTLCWGAYLDDALLLISNREAEHCLQRTDGRRPDEEAPVGTMSTMLTMYGRQHGAWSAWSAQPVKMMLGQNLRESSGGLPPLREMRPTVTGAAV